MNTSVADADGLNGCPTESTLVSRRSMVGLVWALVLVFGLTACGSTPSRVATTDQAGTVSTTAGGSKGGVLARRGGGYYKDDGPDDVLPPNLDQIPEAVPVVEPLHRPALRPYTVMGQHFVPRTELTPFKQRGYASWYGRRFHGNPTSIGEPYDMYAMTAAHPTLPIPSYARVTHLDNGRSVVVRINDRGPFLRGRVIDLSYAAAHRLGYINTGSAHVEVESITHGDIRAAHTAGVLALPGMASGVRVVASNAEPPPAMVATSAAALTTPALVPSVVQAPAPSAATVTEMRAALPALPAAPQDIPAPVASVGQTRGAYLQLGAFLSPSNADGLVDRVRNELGIFADRLHLFDEGGRYRLQLGPFASADDARLEAGRIGALLNLQPFVVMR